MEPILELATRITTHIWFLHELYPDETQLIAIRDRNWRGAAEPNGYSQLQNLLDLAGIPAEWTAREWLCPYKEPEAPISMGRPEGYTPRSVYQWAMKRRRQRWVRETRANWNLLQKAKRQAFDIIGQRFDALQENRMTAVSLAPEAPRPDPRARAPQSSPGAPSLTRELLYERVVVQLLAATPLNGRVALARAFLPGGEFFIEEHITFRAKLAMDTFRRDSPRCARAQEWLHPPENSDVRLRRLLDAHDFRELCLDLGVAVPFSVVQRDELNEIAASRLVRLGIQPEGKSEAQIRHAAGIAQTEEGTAEHQAYRSNLFGLALSGGGIRSATFALGLLQGMADRNILPHIDILSTVSGGGYIGSWLISWIKRRGGVASVQQSMRGNATSLQRGGDCPDQRTVGGNAPVPEPFGQVSHNIDPHADHVRPIRLLRQYARYLAPQAGLLAADTWTIASTWARNTTLNLLILVAILGAALLAPRLATYLLLHVHAFQPERPTSTSFAVGIGVVAALLWAGCLLIGGKNLATFGPYRRTSRTTRGYGDSKVVSRILPLIMLGAFAEVAFIWYSRDAANSAWGAVAFTGVVLVGLYILGLFSKSWDESRLSPWNRLQSGPFIQRLGVSVAAICAVAVAWLLVDRLYALAQLAGANTERGIWLAASTGVAVVLVAIGLVVLLFIGLLGNVLSDEQREWWSRMGAWLGLALGAWVLICVICFFVPLWIARFGMMAAAGAIGWGTVTGWGSKLAYSPKSSREGGADSETWINSAVLALAPVVFVLGLLSVVSFGLFWLIGWLAGLAPRLAYTTVSQHLSHAGAALSWQGLADHYWSLMYPGSLVPVLLLAVLVVIGLALAWRVDINQFSMHNFYKNRLVRCYLGASRLRPHREPNAFTGFDVEDDIRLFRFRLADSSQPRDMLTDCQPSYRGPFPIINTTLNVTQGGDLGLQERKGESFIFTPLWSGFDFSRRQASVKSAIISEYGFRQTSTFGEPQNLGVSLGTAMAISGAAFNSNAGFHTSPSLAFLLTVFGVRMGWWAGNPRREDWTAPSPPIALASLARELTATTTTDSPFVLLSDGGHFENMGLYELVRRRCRYIILSDAEEDAKFKLEGIGGAIRKCRVDFGAVIDLNLEALQPLGDPAISRLHYSLGTILYPGESDCGRLVYIKSSVTGDEPVDVIEFRKRHAEFPHTSTANQFFDESDFESYRALGQHVAQGIFHQDMKEEKPRNPAEIHSAIQQLFKQIEQDWEANLAATKEGKSGDKKN